MNKLLIIFLLPWHTYPVTIVYNLRIAQATKHRITEVEAEDAIRTIIKRGKIKTRLKHPFAAALTSFDQLRHRKDSVEQNIGGAEGTLLWTSGLTYLRMDFAAAHLKEKAHGICTAHDQTDDILLSAGFSRIVTERTRFTFSGLFGIPTHPDEGLQRLQLGTGHVGIGLQIDGSFSYMTYHPNHALLAAVRLVHFFPRTACGPMLPAHPPVKFNVDPGNFADLLVAHYSRWGNNALELGYNPAFAFGAHICPPLDIHLTSSAMRNSFYVNYRRLFSIRSHVSGLGIGVSYGFDNLPILGFSRIGTVWIGWGISF